MAGTEIFDKINEEEKCDEQKEKSQNQISSNPSSPAENSFLHSMKSSNDNFYLPSMDLVSSSSQQQVKSNEVLDNDLLNQSYETSFETEYFDHDEITSNIDKSSFQTHIYKKYLSASSRELKLRREVKELKETIDQKNKEIIEWKKKYDDLIQEISFEDNEISAEVNFIKKGGSKQINSSLLHYVVLKHQLRENLIKFPTEKEKAMFAKVISGEHIEKYGFIEKTSNIVSRYKQVKYGSNLSDTCERKKFKSKKVIETMTESVKNFLEKDENSAMAPGASETIVHKGQSERKRYLLDTMKNLYEKYKQETLISPFTAVNLSQTTFFRLKPFWIVKKKVSARDTCLCKSHDNFKLLINKLSTLNLIKEKSTKDYLSSVTCSSNNKECYYNDCLKCKSKLLPVTLNLQTTWVHQWINKSIERVGSKDKIFKVRVTFKERIDLTISDLVEEFNKQLPLNLKHIYDTHHQYEALSIIKDSLKLNEVYIVIDFSQNYICKYAEEIQGTHFGASKKQISLHTGAFYFRDVTSGLLKHVTFCSASECLKHDPAAIWAHLQPVFKLIQVKLPGATVYHFQSDGPCTQYKNKDNYFLFNNFCKTSRLASATWNYTTPGHGKGCADGVGGTVKGICDRAVANGKNITSVEDVVKVIESSGTIVKIFPITAEDIAKFEKIILQNLKSAPNSSKIFQLVWKSNYSNCLDLNYLSCSYCVCNGLSHCTHFSLNPSHWPIDTVIKSSSVNADSKKIKNELKQLKKKKKIYKKQQIKMKKKEKL